jgi:predicted DNA-binding transcriptional regulator AlpA
MEKEGDRIVGIKAIADYLDASERSVYRWEKELALPLHRVSGSAGSSVYVYISELEEWLKKRESADKALLRSRKSRVLIVFSLTAIALIVIVIAYFILRSRQILFKTDIPNPTTSVVSGNMVHVKDARGKDIWSFVTHFGRLDPETWWKKKALDFLDIDKDGANEVVGRVYEPVADKFFLTLFDNDGKILWKKSITNEQKYNGLHLKSNFIPVRIRFAEGREGQIFIVSYWRHKARFLSFIMSHDLQGRLVNKYVHTGHLESLAIHDLDRDGSDEILFAGTNNLLKGEGVLGVLDLSDFRGVCPPYRIEPEYSHLAYRLEKYIPDNPVPGNQILYLRFKRLPHFEKKQHTYIFAALHDIDEVLIHAQLFPFDLKHGNSACCFEYIFNRNFDLLYMIPDSSMIKVYPDIAQSAEKKFSLREIVEAYSKSIFRWENGGWVPVAQIF